MNSFEEAERLHEITSRYEHEGNYAVQYNSELAAHDMLLVLESHTAQAKELARLREALEIITGLHDMHGKEVIDAVLIAKAALRGKRE